MQTKFDSLKESFLNILIGYVVAIFSQLAIFPLFGIDIPLFDNLLMGLYFTVISFFRNYILRRFFNKKTVEKLMNKKEYRKNFYADYDVYTNVMHPVPQEYIKGKEFKIYKCVKCEAIGAEKGPLGNPYCSNCLGRTESFGKALYDGSIIAWLKKKETK